MAANWLSQQNYPQPDTDIITLPRRNWLADQANDRANAAQAEDVRRNDLYEQQLSQQGEAQRNALLAREKEDTKQWVLAGAQTLASLKGNPQAFMQMAQRYAADPRARQLGLDISHITPEAVDGLLAQAQMATATAPQAPERMTPYQQAQIDVERAKLNRPATPKEDNSPLETIVDPATGQPKLVRRGDAVGAQPYVKPPAAAGMTVTDKKAQLAAKQKLPQVKALARRVERVAQASEAIAKNRFVDGGRFDGKILAWSKEGQELEQAGGNLVQTLTALTRIPGVGSQSDLEQRLAMLQIPSSDMPPEVRANAVNELRQFMADLEQAIGGVADGSYFQDPTAAAAPAGVAPTGGGGWSVEELKQ